MKQTRSKIKSDILLRVRMLYLFFFVLGGVIFCRLVWVQFLSKEVSTNAKRIENRIVRHVRVPAHRGAILARNGAPLAASIFRYRLSFDFSSEGFDSLELFQRHTDSLAKLLSAYFKDRTTEQYRNFFRREHARRYRVVYRKDTQVLRSSDFLGRLIDRLRGERFRTEKLYDTLRDPTLVSILPRQIDYAEWQTMKRWPVLNGNMGYVYNLEELDQRIYPQGELARRTIGLAGDRGNYGIEAVYREALAGRDGEFIKRRIAYGFAGRMPGGTDPVDGCDVITTIDLDLQDFADKTLRQQLEKQHAIWGTTLVMETSTGDLLAMVNLGRRKDGSYGELENYALGRRMEPGSTLKLVSLLALVEDRGLPLSLSYDSGGGRTVIVGKAKVRDAHGGYFMTDLKTATAQSLNVYYAKAIYEAYKDKVPEYIAFLKHLHMDRPVGLEDFGEKAPLLPQPGTKYWYPHLTLPNMGYGYGIEMTPLHTLTLYNAVANGGRMVAPRLIREIRRGERTIEKTRVRVLVDRICSERSLRTVRECLEEVARTGTAKFYFGDTTHMRVGAKTGTAKFAQGGIQYADGYYLGTMVNYLPADNPRYTLLTAIFTRKGYGTAYSGAGLSGIVQQQLARYLFNREPDWFSTVSDDPYPPQRLRGGEIAQLREVADEADVDLVTPVRSGWGRTRTDSTGRMEIVPLQASGQTMPDVRGMGFKDALYLLESRGLRVRFTGKGEVRQQTIVPGTPIRRGETVTITLK